MLPERIPFQVNETGVSRILHEPWVLNLIFHIIAPVGVALLIGYLLVYVLEWA